jgi:hypothetical protein
MRAFCISVLTVSLGAASLAMGDEVIYRTGSPTGFFTPITSSTPAGTKFGDSGWITGINDIPVEFVNSITLGLAVADSGGRSLPAGRTDILFTFNDGDPSGLVFGPGNTFHSTTITNVELPAIVAGGPTYFDLRIPLPSITLSGGFNNVGWSVGVQNFQYDGEFGFQNRSAFNALGFMTGNASQFTPGSGWSLFAFGPAFPGNSANFVATITIPEPATLSALAASAVLMGRRRR